MNKQTYIVAFHKGFTCFIGIEIQHRHCIAAAVDHMVLICEGDRAGVDG